MGLDCFVTVYVSELNKNFKISISQILYLCVRLSRLKASINRDQTE